MDAQQMYALDLCEVLTEYEDTDVTMETIQRMIDGAVGWDDVYAPGGLPLGYWGYEWDEQRSSWLNTGGEYPA